jgi:hypothetical protein
MIAGGLETSAGLGVTVTVTSYSDGPSESASLSASAAAVRGCGTDARAGGPPGPPAAQRRLGRSPSHSVTQPPELKRPTPGPGLADSDTVTQAVRFRSSESARAFTGRLPGGLGP